MACPFCHPDRPVIAENDQAFAMYDAYPVTPGHALVMPVRHVKCFFDLEEAEQRNCWELVREVREQLARTYQPDGFTIGLNDGEVAGQTVMHAHVHVIPRREGDVEDPIGGVRKALDRGKWGE